MRCLHSLPAGAERTESVGPTGDCLAEPSGAFVGAAGSVWYFCRAHRDDVNAVVCEHADVRDFPLREMTADEARAAEVMES